MGLHGKKWIIGLCAAAITFGSVALAKKHGGGSSSGGDGASDFQGLQVTKLIVMPNSAGHTDWIDAINNARSSVHMTMYHLTDPAVIKALENKARDKSVDVRVIVDGGSLTGGYLTAFQGLQQSGVQAVGSSRAFSLTHSKAMVVDGQTAFVTAINMTNTFNNTRDFGVITSDSNVINEVEQVFAADWQNAQNSGDTTPTVTDPNLTWAPTTADTDLVALINSANRTIVAETETFSDSAIISALNKAVSRGVNVRLIVPECVLGNGTYNYKYLNELKGVIVHVEHDGDSVDQPYMHSKMMLVDGQTAYIGSINYTLNSMDKDREVGVVFMDSAATTQLAGEFETDWGRSGQPSSSPSCSKSNDINVEQRDMGYSL